MKRVVIYAKDLMIITGKSERSARNLIFKIKMYFGKQQHQYISIEDVSRYLGISEELIRRMLS